MSKDAISFMKFVRNVTTIDEVKTSFESGECDHYYQLEIPCGCYPANSYNLIKVAGESSGLSAYKNKYRENTRISLLNEKQ